MSQVSQISDYLDMVSYRRPAGGDTERDFINKFIMPLGVEVDDYGNLWKEVGTGSPVIWCCHTDTVHRMEGIQRVLTTNNLVTLHPEEKQSNCLGADCTTGVWMLKRMIEAGVPGLYIFHREEECGAGGAKHIARNHAERLAKYKFAIEFDRYGTTSIITFQGGRCCSEAFSQSVSAQIPRLRSDPGGIFTDTAMYTEIVPECTNFSVGYNGHHTAREYQDWPYMVQLLDEMINLDQSKLVASRDPSVKEAPSYGWGSFYEEDWDAYFPGKYSGGTRQVYVQEAEETIEEILVDEAAVIADIFDSWGIDARELRKMVDQYKYSDPNNEEIETH